MSSCFLDSSNPQEDVRHHQPRSGHLRPEGSRRQAHPRLHVPRHPGLYLSRFLSLIYWGTKLCVRANKLLNSVSHAPIFLNLWAFINDVAQIWTKSNSPFHS